MIQRIQSVYLLLTAAVAVVGLFLPLWIFDENTVKKAFDYNLIFALFALIIVLAIATIFFFKKRKLQFVLNRINILINITLLGIFGYHSLIFPGEELSSEKGIGLIVPFISIVILFLANKAIKKDEELVKSVDRLR